MVVLANINPADAPEVTTSWDSSPDRCCSLDYCWKGLFDKYGMTGVEVSKQASCKPAITWCWVRGGGIDGAHILSPMPYLMSLGTITKGNKVPMYPWHG